VDKISESKITVDELSVDEMTWHRFCESAIHLVSMFDLDAASLYLFPFWMLFRLLIIIIRVFLSTEEGRGLVPGYGIEAIALNRVLRLG